MNPFRRETTEEKVERTAVVLDHMVPDWVDRIPDDVSRIELYNTRSCVLGYVFGDFWRGRRLMLASVKRRHWDLVHCPVLAPYNYVDINNAKAAWMLAIENRRRAA